MDLITWKAYYFDGENGEFVREEPIPESLVEMATEKKRDNPTDNSKDEAQDRIARYAALNSIPPRIVQPMPHHHWTSAED